MTILLTITVCHSSMPACFYINPTKSYKCYYRKESAAFLPHELNAKVCISKQFSKGKFTFDPMASFPRFIIGSKAGLHTKVISPMFPAQMCFSFIV